MNDQNLTGHQKREFLKSEYPELHKAVYGDQPDFKLSDLIAKSILVLMSMSAFIAWVLIQVSRI